MEVGGELGAEKVDDAGCSGSNTLSCSVSLGRDEETNLFAERRMGTATE